MTLVRFSRNLSPWKDFEPFTSRLSQVFDEPFFSGPLSAGDWTPAVNVEERDTEMVLTAEIPGLKEEDIDVQLENNVLTIRGQKTEERTEETGNGEQGGGSERRFHVWERRYGSFQRSFTLPRTVDGEGIEADYKDGILEVRMPKVAEAKGRKIRIGSGK